MRVEARSDALLEQLEARHQSYRRRVLLVVTGVLAGFPFAAFSLGGTIVTPRVLAGLFAAELCIGLTLFFAWRGRIETAVAFLAAGLAVATFDAHVVHQGSPTATFFPTLLIVLGFVLLERPQAKILAGAMVALVLVMRVGRMLAGPEPVHWFPATIDPLTLAIAVGLLSAVHRERVDRDTALLREMLVETEAQRAQLARARDLAETSARAAQKASRTRSLFFSRVGHELRTPLNAILGYAELLLEDHEGDELCQDLGCIRSAAVHQLDLVDDLLELTRSQVGATGVTLEEVELPKLVERVESRLAPLLAARGNVLETHVDVEMARVDSSHVERVLMDLLTNAATFTERGKIALHVQEQEHSTGRALELLVEDSGVGIDASRIPHLFEPFTQGEACSADVRQGTGLGLAIVKSLVDAMDGHCTVESEVGRGSRFGVVVPLT